MLNAVEVTSFLRTNLRPMMEEAAPVLQKNVSEELFKQLMKLPGIITCDEEGEITRGNYELQLLEYGSSIQKVPALQFGSRLRSLLEAELEKEVRSVE